MSLGGHNHVVGLVTDGQVGEVMAQVETQCGPHRVVSRVSREMVDDLGLTPRARGMAVIAATDVDVQVPPTAGHRPEGDGAAQ